jgi:hypothetical protein
MKISTDFNPVKVETNAFLYGEGSATDMYLLDRMSPGEVGRPKRYGRATPSSPDEKNWRFSGAIFSP